jgi:thiamine-phosphate pyrophosphorylase
VAALSLFKEAKRSVNIPMVAIGGITTQNVALALNAGADTIAVVGALFNVNNDLQQITRAAQDFSAIFDAD